MSLPCKMFEIRDNSTLIAVFAIKLRTEVEAERWLLARCGYGLTKNEQQHYVMLCKADGDKPECHYDPYTWRGVGRTMHLAHTYIIANYDSLASGDVVDVQFILNETSTCKVSERLTQ